MAESEEDQDRGNGQIRHALVFEDSELDSDMLSSALRVYGIKDVEVVTDVTEVPALPPGEASLVIIDLILRDSDGFEVIRMLREKRYAGRVLIVSATARDMIPQAVQLAKASGLNVIDGMVKPVDLERLKIVLAESSAKG